MAPLFMVPKLENRELGDIFFQLRLDCPEIFYASGFHYRFYPEANKVEMIPEYLFEKGKIKEHRFKTGFNIRYSNFFDIRTT